VNLWLRLLHLIVASFFRARLDRSRDVSRLVGRDRIQAGDTAHSPIGCQPHLHGHLPPPSTFPPLMIDEIPSRCAPASELLERKVRVDLQEKGRRGLLARIERAIRRA
jgi:hypothetical protein